MMPVLGTPSSSRVLLVLEGSIVESWQRNGLLSAINFEANLMT